MTKKYNILYIHHGGGQGGGFKSLLTTINHIDKSKYNIKVAILNRSIACDVLEKNGIKYEVLEDIIYSKYRYYFIHSEVGPVKWFKFIYFIKVLIYWLLSAFIFAPKFLKKEKPDIVHINSSVLSDWSMAAKRLKIKNIVHIREPIANGYFGLRKRILYNIYKNCADIIIAISKDNAQRLGIPSKTVIVYDNIDIVPLPKTQNSLENYSKKSILYAGGTELHKGFIDFAKSIEFINNDIKIVIAGLISVNPKKKWMPSYKKNQLKIELYNRISKLSNVEFVGFTTDIEGLLKECTVSISPFSKPHCSMLVLESYAMRKPAIGSDVKGMEELIDNGKSGLLYSQNSPKELAEKINYICDNPSVAKRMGEYGFLKYKKTFDQNYTIKYESIYSKILDENK